jgi:hypothetical protein
MSEAFAVSHVILSFQTAVGPRFEHLGANRDWYEHREYFRGQGGLRIACDGAVNELVQGVGN